MKKFEPSKLQTSTGESLDELCQRLYVAKLNEDEFKEERVDIENAIAAMVAKKDEGTDSVKAGGYKVTVTSKLNRTLDYEAYLAIENDIPEGVRCVDLKPSINITKLRAMDMVRPGFSASFITSKPAKASVKIEVL